MGKTCEVESCDNEAEYYDEMDNLLCEEHMYQDMEETEGDPSDYEKIEECGDCKYWNEKLVDVPARGQCMHPKNRGQVTKINEGCPKYEKK
jgi:hypothetical protein